jgi:hypothetical protein
MSVFKVNNLTGSATAEIADLGNVSFPTGETVIFDTSNPGSSPFSRETLAQSEDLQALIGVGSGQVEVTENDVAFVDGQEFYTAIAILESEIRDYSLPIQSGETPIDVSQISEAAVTQHETALTVTESQISDLKDYALASDIVGLLDYKGAYDAAADSPQLEDRTTGAEPVAKGDVFTVTVAGTFHGVTLEVGDLIIAEVDIDSTDAAGDDTDWTVVERNLDDAVTAAQLTSIDDLNGFFTSDILYDWTQPAISGQPQIDASHIPTTVSGKLSWSITAATKDEATDDRDLQRLLDVHTNETPYIIPVACKLVAIAKSSVTQLDWTAIVRGSTAGDTTLAGSGNQYDGAVDVSFAAGEEVRLRFDHTGNNIEKPAIEAFFQAV